MPKRNIKQTRRIRNLIIISALSAIVLTVSTFAWFVGTQIVNIANFDIEIAAADSLLLSLDGASWNETVSISKATLEEVSYDGHTNNWAGRGLIPMSSIGAMDDVVSRMKLFEKASLTHTPGGYRLMASRVENYDGEPERDGYVVFDLFIKNFSGTQYIDALNELDEEAIFLTVDSGVTVAAVGGVPGTGIENSVRVAFTQIGRVSGTTDNASLITGITCVPNPETQAGVTGICREAQIWEPNDQSHVANAIRYYETSCLKRKAADLTLESSYGPDPCGTVIDGKAYPTYAVATPIVSADKVDVYDGPVYNGYTPTLPPEPPLLVSFPYFTDSMKLLRGTDRPEFMRLAPNSITKVRIYIYIEGQDVDNYDFASIGRKISVKFGFTKQRFTEDDIDYNGPDVNQGEGPDGADKTAPVITVLGDNPTTLTVGAAYEDAGASAADNIDGDLTLSLETSGTVNTEVPGIYTIIYKATDAAGNTGTKTRTVIVQELP